MKKEGAATAEGSEKEIADAEAKRTQARMESEAGASGEGRIVNQIEKAPREAKPFIKKNYTKEEVPAKGGE